MVLRIILAALWLILTGILLCLGFWVGGKVTGSLDRAIEKRRAREIAERTDRELEGLVPGF